MRRWAKVAAIATGGGAAAAVVAAAVGARVWNRATERTIDRLVDTQGGEQQQESLRFSPDQLEGLPPPVVRYFELALTPGQRLVRRAHLRFDGTFAARPGAWARFTAEQEFTVHPPGFVWDARIAMMPPVTVRVRDSYVSGEGAMLAKVAGLVPIADQHGTPEMAAGSLLRYLAETVWFPTALLPRDGLSWEAIDDTSARVTLTDGPTTVSLDVRFGADGEIAEVSAMRHRDVNGSAVLTPWEGRHTTYERIDGMLIPTEGEAAWLPPEGRAAYWRGRVIDARYDW
jgi:hypothetical protein